MRTKIGEFLRNLRMTRNQRLKDMADILGVSSAFLSAIENGKKSMPDVWVEKVREKYDISDEECARMKQLALESQKSITLNMKNASSINRELAVSFARQFDEIDEETSRKIMRVLKNRKKV